MTGVSRTEVGAAMGSVAGLAIGCVLFILKISYQWHSIPMLLSPIIGMAGGAVLGAIFGAGIQWKEWMESRPDAKTLGHVVSVKQNAAGLPEHIHFL